VKPDWVSPRAALATIVESVQALEPVSVDLRDARGLTLAAPVIAPIDLPRWTNSGMDGFAVHSAEIAGAGPDSPIDLPVVDDIAAGSFPRGPLPRGSAARVMTGAPVPEGADTIVRVEDTDGGSGIGAPNGRVRILDGRDAGRNLRRQGEEISRGAVALREGTLLNPGAIGIAASLGQETLSVHRRPVVAVLTSGDELVHVERFKEVVEGRKIVSSNSYALTAALEDCGCEVRYLGIAEDTPEALRNAIDGAAGCDALITSGGISVGKHDYVREVLVRLGTAVRFWRVKMRPGSPFAFGILASLGGIPWFGLPGNPVSSAVTFELFCRPAFLRMAGARRVHRQWIPARLLDPFEIVPGLTQFIRVRLDREPSGGFVASLAGAQGSAHLSSVATADALMIVDSELAIDPTAGVHRTIPINPGFHGMTPPL
jgi:molybdopterin molybdotransferase